LAPIGHFLIHELDQKVLRRSVEPAVESRPSARRLSLASALTQLLVIRPDCALEHSKSLFLLPRATRHENKNSLPSSKRLIELVAGTGFEPVTFGL
jgi:hypothetical protein